MAVNTQRLAHQPLGRTDLSTAMLSLGTVKLGRDRGVKYPTAVKIPTKQQATTLLKSALDLGINLIDTAPAYGTSEARLGELLEHSRREWIICTKVGEEFDGEHSSHDFSPQHCRMSVERSLQRLRCDVLDIVLIHSNGDDEAILKDYGTLETLLELKAAGLIRAVGISHYSDVGAELAIAMGADVLMTTLNSSDQSKLPLIKSAADKGVGILVKKALGSGHSDPADLRFVADQPGVGTIVVGTTNIEHLRLNASYVA